MADLFHRTLETEIATLRTEIAVNAETIAVLERVVQRRRDLAGRGVGSSAELDEASLRLTGAKAREADLNSQLKYALLRNRSAEAGVYIATDGGTPDWLHYGELELKLEQQRLRHELDRAEARLADVRTGLELAQKALADLSSAPVPAPQGAHVFSLLAAPDAVVAAGQPVIEWIDCSILLVDVPVPDARDCTDRQGRPGRGGSGRRVLYPARQPSC